jgi:DNA-binding NarL/FixJ family response regulator
MKAAHAADYLSTQAQIGRLDRQVVDALFVTAGHQAPQSNRQIPAGLSERELEVLTLAVRGLSNRQIAESLFLSPKTVGHHLESIYGKIGVSTRVGATLFALQHGLV